jgi:hypothetical protein
MMELLKDCLDSSGSDSEHGDSGIVQGRVEGTAKKKPSKSPSPGKKHAPSPERKKEVEVPKSKFKGTRNHALEGDGAGIGMHKSGDNMDDEVYSESSQSEVTNQSLTSIEEEVELMPNYAEKVERPAKALKNNLGFDVPFWTGFEYLSSKGENLEDLA